MNTKTLPLPPRLSRAITAFSRLAARRKPVPSVVQNRFCDVAVPLNQPAQAGLGLVKKLLATDLRHRLASADVRVPSDYSIPQLLQLSLDLPGPEGTVNLSEEPVVLAHPEFILLGGYIEAELRWLDRMGVSRLGAIELPMMRWCLQCLVAALAQRTRILTWDELCKLES